MEKDKRTSRQRSGRKGRKILPALCSMSGTLILISVIAVCIPITLPKLLGYGVYNVVSGSMEPESPWAALFLSEKSRRRKCRRRT